MKRLVFSGLMAVVLMAGMWACAPAVHTESDESQPLETFTTALFDPSAGIIPFPNSLLMDRTTGTVNIPNPDGLDAIASVNSLNGFSTTAPMTFYLDGAPNSSTVNSGTIKVFDVTSGAAEFGSEVPVQFMAFDPATGAQSMVPMTPLKPRHTYAAIVTTGVTDTNGNPIEPSQVFYLVRNSNPLVDGEGHTTTSLLDDASAGLLEMLRQSMIPVFDFLSAIGISRSQVAVAFTFTTQSTYQDLVTLRGQLDSMIAKAAPQPVFTGQYLGDALVAAFYGNVEAATGIEFPYANVGGVLTGAFPSPNFMTHPLAGYFMKDAEGHFVKQSDALVPFILTVPKGSGPFPVVIFQHGITRTKMDALAIADTFAAAGLATVSMDLVLHGDRAGDYMDNTTGEMVPDGVLDPSGGLFINLTSLRTGRDNIRQSVVDQMQLVRMLAGGVDYTGDSLPDLAPSMITFTGTSLGGMTGTVLHAVEPAIKTAVLNVPGGLISQLLITSPTFAPTINAGLEQNGVIPGTPEYQQFWLLAQTVIDSADPINYAPYVLNGMVSGTEKYALMQEAIGDQVIPNAVTEMLARAMGPSFPHVEPVVQTVPGMATSPQGVASGFFQFDTPNHGFLLSPDPSAPQYTYWGQLQTVNYLGAYLLSGTPVIVDPVSLKGKAAGADSASEWALRSFPYTINARAAVYVR